MPEIWLNYGKTEVVLDILAENLAGKINSNTTSTHAILKDALSPPLPLTDTLNTADSVKNSINTSSMNNNNNNVDSNSNTLAKTPPLSSNTLNILEPLTIAERLDSLDLSKPFDLILMHDSPAVRQITSSIFTLCEQRSISFPGILADKDILSDIKKGLPEGSVANEFAAQSLDTTFDDKDTDIDNATIVDDHLHKNEINKRNLVFVAETEFDGLFGYETVATRLIRKFGTDEMLAAYAKRDGNAPSPGKRTKCLDEATKFVDKFEIDCIDIVTNINGVYDIFVGHPSITATQASSSLESHSIIDIAEHQKTLIASTGKTSSSLTLKDALSSVWNCHNAMRNKGLFMLIAECSRGLGCDALRMYVEGRLSLDHLNNPSVYIDGMEELLFLSQTKQKCQIALVSVLPELYTNKLGIISISGMKHALEYVKTTQGARQKSTIIIDASRLLLR